MSPFIKSRETLNNKRMKYEVINRDSKNSPYLLKVSIYSEEFEIEGRNASARSMLSVTSLARVAKMST